MKNSFLYIIKHKNEKFKCYLPLIINSNIVAIGYINYKGHNICIGKKGKR